MTRFRFLTLLLLTYSPSTSVSVGAGETQDPAASPPPVNFQAGPEYADKVRMFQGIPSLERSPNGRLWATWYGGGVTEDRIYDNSYEYRLNVGPVRLAADCRSSPSPLTRA